MRKIEMPEMKFTKWHKWEEREQKIPDCNKPGIYLISITDNNGLEDKPHDWKDVSYIGMSNSKAGLKGRWHQFDKAMQTGKPVHSGGLKVHKDQKKAKLVFVAAMVIDCDVQKCNELNLIKMGQVAYLEYEAFAEFYKHSGKDTGKERPPYNTK